MSETSTRGIVWLYSDDRIFSDRIAAVAAARAIPFRRIGDADLAELPGNRGLLILDLDKGIDSVTHAIRCARSVGPDAWHVCGYGSHVDAEGLRALRDAGADRVTSRSRLLHVVELIITEVVTR